MVKTFKNIVCQNFEVIRGDTTDNIAFSLVDPSFPGGLLGATIKMWLSTNNGITKAKELTTENGGISITDSVACEFSILPYLCDIPAANYQYDIQITYPSDIVKTRFKGCYSVKIDQTR